MAVLEFAGELTVLRCWCGIQHAVPSALRAEQLRKAGEGGAMSIYCPLGHAHVPSGVATTAKEKEIEQLKHSLQSARDDAEWQRQEKLRAHRKTIAQRGLVTKMRKRIAAGNCPCCTRHFDDLAKHVATAHPHYQELVRHEQHRKS